MDECRFKTMFTDDVKLHFGRNKSIHHLFLRLYDEITLLLTPMNVNE